MSQWNPKEGVKDIIHPASSSVSSTEQRNVESSTEKTNAESTTTIKSAQKRKSSDITQYGTLLQKRVSISVSKKMVIQSLLAKVTIDGRPFSSLEDVSYKYYSQPAMKALNIHYDRKNISELVDRSAVFLKEKLRQNLKNSLVCIKVGCATRNKRSFLGLNVQVCINLVSD